MKWLVWKEYRLNRVVLVVGATLLVVPHAVALALAWRDVGPSIGGVSRLSANLLISGFYSLGISQLTLALLGGHVIACERADRSAEFVAYLPVSRARILAGKITLALLTAALIWGPNLLILRFVGELPEESLEADPTVCGVLGYIALTGFVFFSVGWLFSSMLESPTFSICAGLITPFLVLMGIQSLAWLFTFRLGEIMEPWYRNTSLVLACACFVAGTWYYLRRVEP